MTSLKKVALIYLSWNILIFLRFAFFTWNWNPYHWGEFTRTFYVVASPILGFFVSGLVYTGISNTDFT